MLEIRRGRIVEAWHELRRPVSRALAARSTLLHESNEKALAACVAYYRDLLLLENYAIMNYCGFSKILKKHDKRTGHETRARFMRVCVTPQPFTHYPRLLEMIKEAEELYRELAKLSTCVRSQGFPSLGAALDRGNLPSGGSALDSTSQSNT